MNWEMKWSTPEFSVHITLHLLLSDVAPRIPLIPQKPFVLFFKNVWMLFCKLLKAKAFLKSFHRTNCLTLTSVVTNFILVTRDDTLKFSYNSKDWLVVSHSTGRANTFEVICRKCASASLISELKTLSISQSLLIVCANKIEYTRDFLWWS